MNTSIWVGPRSFRGSHKTSQAVLLLLMVPLVAVSQTGASSRSNGEIVFDLSPFEVSTSREDSGYAGQSTLAGNRLNTDVRDIGNAVSVITKEFLDDLGATDNTSLLQYTPNTEVGGIYGNYAGLGDGRELDESSTFGNPNSNTRVRGLSAADNTRDFFVTDIPWDGYNIAGVDLQRGPNSILFGQGKPAGIINARPDGAAFYDTTRIRARYGSYGRARAELNTNQVLLPDELAIRVAGVYDDVGFQQKPAFRTSRRIYGALRYEPKLLKREGARTILRGNWEAGDITSNHPRGLPPYDNITPWFYEGTYVGYADDGSEKTYQYTDRETYGTFQLGDRSGRRPGRGNLYEVLETTGPYGGENASYNPWLGPWRYENVVANFDGTSTDPLNYMVWEPRAGFGRNRVGAISRSIGGIPFDRPASIASYSEFAINARLPFYEWGIHKNKTLSDPSVFDYNNNLIDGPNKREWTHFRVYNTSLAQTFFYDKMGVEAVYNREDVRRGQRGVLGSPQLRIDVMDGRPDFSDNPNVGRPFIYGIPGNNTESVSKRESVRFTGFMTHDFTQDRDDSWLTRFLGRHTLTALYGEDQHDVDNRRWQRYGVGDDYLAFMNFPEGSASQRFNTNSLTPVTVIYLGPSLMNRSSASGAYIPNPREVATITNGYVRVFDSTWNAAPGVGFNDPWIETEYIGTPDNPLISTQSENPANYVGWVDMPVEIIDSETSRAHRDSLTTAANMTRRKVKSNAFVWQGHLLNNSVVGTWGWREDESTSWGTSRNVNHETSDEYGRLNLSPESYRLPDDPDNRLKVQTRAWTVVTHLNQFPGLDSLMEPLPVNVSLYYNDSSNFEALSQRVDFMGQRISPPAGKTIDKGVRLETKDGRWSLRVNHYETTVTDASSSALSGAYAIGGTVGLGTNWARRFEYKLLGYTLADAPEGYDDPYDHPSWSSFRYQARPGQTQEEADAEMMAGVNAWNNWIDTVDPAFFEAWSFDPYNLNEQAQSVAPQGLAVTENSRSEGFEIEVSALPMPNWRLTLNASQTEAVRYDVGGAELSEFMESFQDLMDNTPAGDLRIWWGASNATTAKIIWNQNIGSEWAQRKLQEGTSVPELREWRVNFVSNYRITSGPMKDVNIGGAVRYQSSVATGYRPIPIADGESMNFDIANPYKGPSETNYDVWVGYKRRLTDRMDLTFQLNIRNIFQARNKLIPITVQPDGSPAAFRISEKRTWEFTSTLEF